MLIYNVNWITGFKSIIIRQGLIIFEREGGGAKPSYKLRSRLPAIVHDTVLTARPVVVVVRVRFRIETV